MLSKRPERSILLYGAGWNFSDKVTSLCRLYAEHGWPGNRFWPVTGLFDGRIVERPEKVDSSCVTKETQDSGAIL